MTREEAIAYLQNKKVYVKDKQKEILIILSDLGFGTIKDITNEQALNYPFIYINKDGIQFGGNNSIFRHSTHEEITAEQIISLHITTPKEFKPFDKVLVRNSPNKVWQIDLFVCNHSELPYKYQCLSNIWKQCIPYEGNEHLLNTR